MKVRGYTRPLFAADDTAADVAELHELGVSKVVVESGYRTVAQRSRMIASLQPGDALVVTSLERLDPRLDGLIRTLLVLSDRGVALRCAALPDLDAGSESVTDMLRALADYARRTTSRATRAGMKAGKKPGRPPALDESGVEMVRELRRLDRSIPHIARVLGVSQTTVHRIVSDS